MRSFSEITDDEKILFLSNYKVVDHILDNCMKVCALEILGVTKYRLHPIGADYKYIKYQFYTLVSAICNTITILVAKDLDVKFDDSLANVCENVKVECALRNFNNSFLNKMPGFVPIHGQDIFLYRSIEFEAGSTDGIVFFDSATLHKQYTSLILEFFDAIMINKEAAELVLAQLVREFSKAFSSENVLNNDLCFTSINATKNQDKDQKFIYDFERFMIDLPDFVYHPGYGASRYAGKGFEYSCSCDRIHSIDTCEAICDGGVAHFAVYRSPCKTSVVKVKSKGLFRIIGIEVSGVVTERETLIDIVCEAISSRKRLD